MFAGSQNGRMLANCLQKKSQRILINKISFCLFGKLRSDKFHELTQAYAGIIIHIALLNCILRAVVEVLGISRYTLPVYIRKIIMTVHGAINVSSLPMILFSIIRSATVEEGSS